ncbi:uncharacterized protein J8A68_000289 [[Candida] subhashii]|uniref:F-box domain-containing protein n=1 Tax=[Candida] subhashii TaxID=561895 RepID=A0A8J5QNA1_9ASCO|nr:uncharacterized protein J8A68_000289 [[Candida] subhashii]KAG7666177.1 hypothetical protein J8A68_000289 [[Candida] subhashii]
MKANDPETCGHETYSKENEPTIKDFTNELVQLKHEQSQLNSVVRDMKNELIQIRHELQKIALSLKPYNDFNRGVFLLPDEILLIILEYVNQMDVFHLALTHRHFENACKRKLFKSIFVYDDFLDGKDIKVINVPKKMYTPFYMKCTVVGLSKLLELIASSYYMPQYMRAILFADDTNVLTDTLDVIAREADRCSISFLDISRSDVLNWVLKHQETTVSEYHLGETCTRQKAYLVKHLLLFEPMSGFINFKRLKSIKVVDPPRSSWSTKIVVEDLSVEVSDQYLEDSFSAFDIPRIRRLEIRCLERNLRKEMAPQLGGIFRSLKALKVTINGRLVGYSEFEMWLQSFLKSLKRNTLEEIDLQVNWNVFSHVLGLCSNHDQSLKVVSVSSTQRVGFRSGQPDFNQYGRTVCNNRNAFWVAKLSQVGLSNYQSLERLIIEGQLLLVSKTKEKFLLPVEFYGQDRSS